MIERGLVGYWSPWLGATGFRLLDRTRYANHGTLTSMDPPTDWVGANILGKSGRVLNIQDNQSVDCGSAPALNFTGPFAVAAWVRNISGAFDFGIVTKLQSSDTYAGWSLLSSDGTNGKILGFWANGTRVTGATTITQNTSWLLVGIDWTGTTARAWLNGSLDGSGSTTTAPNAAASTLHIGQYVFTGNNRSMRGDIAEASAWNRALTAAEWRTLYRLGPGWFGRREPRRRYAVSQAAGFKAYWNQRAQLLGGGLR